MNVEMVPVTSKTNLNEQSDQHELDADSGPSVVVDCDVQRAEADSTNEKPRRKSKRKRKTLKTKSAIKDETKTKRKTGIKKKSMMYPYSAQPLTNHRPLSSRQVERERMRPWLINQVKSGRFRGLKFLDPDQTLICIPWKHAARHGWSLDGDASLFQEWAQHTQKWRPGEEPNPKRWKANFRCAINSLPDVMEVADQGTKRGNGAYKVYRLCTKDEKIKHRHHHKGAAGKSYTQRHNGNISHLTNGHFNEQRKVCHPYLNMPTNTHVSRSSVICSRGGLAPDIRSHDSRDYETVVCRRSATTGVGGFMPSRVNGNNLSGGQVLITKHELQAGYSCRSPVPLYPKDKEDEPHHPNSRSSSVMTDEEVVDFLYENENINGVPQSADSQTHEPWFYARTEDNKQFLVNTGSSKVTSTSYYQPTQGTSAVTHMHLHVRASSDSYDAEYCEQPSRLPTTLTTMQPASSQWEEMRS